MYRPLLILAAVLVLAGCGTTQFSPAAEVPPVVVQQQAPEEPVVGVPVMLAIPKLGVTDDVIPVGLDMRDNSMELPPVTSTGWYKFAPKPGEQGGSVLASHVDWEGTPGAFKRLAELKPGDRVTVTDDKGVVRVFAVYDVRTVLKKDYQSRTVPLVFGARATFDLSLVTCGGRLQGAEYDSNVLALARLVT